MDTAKRNIIIADIGLLLVALFWGGGFVAGKFGLTILPPLTLTAYRYMGAATVMFIFCLRKLRHFRNRKVWLYGLFCGINMFIGNSLQTIGLLYTTAGKQSFIVSLYILLVPLLSWLVLRKRPANSVIVAAIIGFTGIALITLTDNFTVGKGDLMTFALSLTFSVQMIFTAAVVRDIDATVFTFIQLLVVGLLSSVSSIILLTVGYSIELTPELIKPCIKTIIMRICLQAIMMAGVLLAVKYCVGSSRLLKLAVIMYMSAPATFSLQTFLKKKESSAYASTTNSLYCIVSILVYMAAAFFSLQ